jgi:hypothetical protein
MSAFTGPLTMTQLDTDWRVWRIEEPLIYEVGELGSGRVIEVPTGFTTDGASIPRALWALLPTWGRYSRPAVVHDRLGKLLAAGTPHPEAPTQKHADLIFLEAMGVCDEKWIVKMALYLSVRLADHFPALRRLGVHR